MTAISTLARDPALPHLPRALDAERMRREFARRLNCATHDITACAIDRVRHKPGSKALISYRLTLRPAAGEHEGTQLLTARLYPLGNSSERFRKASRECLRPPAFGPPLMHVESLGMVVWAYPNERKLREIVTLEDVQTLRNEILPALVVAHWGRDAAILRVRRDIVHYVPEHGLAARVDVALKLTSGRRRTWCLFAKHYPDDEGHSTFRKMQRLWRSRARTNGSLEMAQPLAYQHERRILWQEAISGTTLANVLDDDPSWMPRAGRAIAALHGTRIRAEQQLTLADLVARLQAARVMLHRALPGLASRLDAVVDRLLLQTVSLRLGRGATLHADLHPKNLLATRSAIALIDLDKVAFGPPLADIGSMIAALYANALLAGGMPSRAQPKIASFLAGYRAHSSFLVTAFELGWYTAAALISERAYRSITRLKAGRLDIVADLIDLADRCSAGEFAWLPRDNRHA